MQGGPLSPDEQRVIASSSAGLHQPGSTIVVAIDRDRNSQLAVKWVVDHLLSGASHIILLHVAAHHPTNHGFAMAETTQGALEAEIKEIFVPYRGFCTRNGVQLSEVVLEETDVSKAIIEYITANKIQSIALGASNRNAFTKKFKNPDVPSGLMKAAPDFCNIYVVAKGKSVNVRLAKCGVLPVTSEPRPMADDSESLRGGPYTKRSSRGQLPPATPDVRRSIDSRTIPELTTRPPFRERSMPASSTKPVMSGKMAASPDGVDGSYRSMRRSISHDFSGDLDFGQSMRFSSMDFGDNLDLSALAASPREPNSPSTGSQREVEAEMRRLRLELKQTMDMYNAACKEAINAKQRAKELQLMKLEEARRLEEARQAEEAALALAEMEKAKCRAAMEAAEAAQRLAELEAQRRRNAEVRARREADEKVRALDAIASQDIRYRKYQIDEIELATERFSESLKIGEGGYGPVYRASLDHTAVAIKVLRPDAQQGRKQFQQEVEVLSCIRHPNMVLLLGACPDYGCLVYEYMDNGSLDKWLHGHKWQAGQVAMARTPSVQRAPLDWPTRVRVAVGAARGLCYMHHECSPPIVHRDVKSSNILLDAELQAKVADFGLARMLVLAGTPDTMSAVAGSFGYMAPECAYTRKVNEKVDVYSFGVVLLELATGREAHDGGAHGSLAEWAWRHLQSGKSIADAADKCVRDTGYADDVEVVFKLGVICTGAQPSTRPTMKDVLQVLLRGEQAHQKAVDEKVAEYEAAPLLQARGGSRRKQLSNVKGIDGGKAGFDCNV